ncbi:MAG: hypothetical protein HZB38_09115 [Planctomycetes bacterium]|nr:hypothetical protein [Planctomycetota bacterium]
MPLYNLHNHTMFSDGAYSIDELCAAHAAMREPRVEGIGISDYLFRMPSSRECRDDAEFERVFGPETRRYVSEVHEARARWHGRLHVFCGCVVNWPLNRKHTEVLRSMLSGIDYVLFENLDWAGLTQLANQSRRFPCPIGLGNTKIREQMPNTSLDQVVRTLANARIFYEISARHMPFSESDPWFAILPQHRVAVALGTDTHDELGAVHTLPILAAYADRRGLSDRLVRPQIVDPAMALAQPA